MEEPETPPVAPEGFTTLRACYPDGSFTWIMVKSDEVDRITESGQVPLVIQMPEPEPEDPEA